MIKMEKDKPIQVYQCPKCNLILRGTYEEAQEHVDIPIDTLPAGLVIKPAHQKDYIVLSKGKSIDSNHGSSQLEYYYNKRGVKTNIGTRMNSRLTKTYLKNEVYFLLTEQEFDKFKKKFLKHSKKPIKKLIRTTSELEKLVSSNPKREREF